MHVHAMQPCTGYSWRAMLTTLQTPCETGLTRESVLKANCAHPTPHRSSVSLPAQGAQARTAMQPPPDPARTPCMQAHPQFQQAHARVHIYAQQSLWHPHMHLGMLGKAYTHSYSSLATPSEASHDTRVRGQRLGGDMAQGRARAWLYRWYSRPTRKSEK